MKTVLTVAGSDCSGGAGIQADIKTITAHKMYASSVITALTAQNTTGVYGIEEVSPEFVARQMDCVFTDIRPDSVKIGMVSGCDIIQTIAAQLERYGAENLVLDPVMVSTSGSPLLREDARQELIGRLMPLADVLTPNLPEAELLCGFPVRDETDMVRAAKKISGRCGGAVLIKGGHLKAEAADLLYENGVIRWFRAGRVANPNTHGTGCTLSSAIACGLADGLSVAGSVCRAKDYLTGALRSMLDLGKGSGPVDHMWRL